MHRLTIPTLMLALAAAAPGALAGADPFVARGSFLAGDPLAYSVMDACGNALQEGIDSSCVALPANGGAKHYSLSARDSFGSLIDASVCFYTADFMMSQCDPWNSRVPQWASYASISALGGVQVHWTLVVEN